MIPSITPFRKKSNWLVSLAVESATPALRLFARWKAGSPPSPSTTWKRALILGDNHIGDLLYRTCALRALKTGLPDCDFSYLAAANTADILAGNPFLKAILPWARSDSRLDLSPDHMSELKAMRFDAVLCTNCIRYWPELLLALQLGIPNRAAYTYKGFSGWVTHPIPIHYPRPYPDYFADYVATLTGKARTDDLKPEVFIPAAAQTQAEAAAIRLGIKQSDNTIAFFLTTRQRTAIWPMERYLRLFELISNSGKTKIVLMGADKDKAFLAAVSASSSVRPSVCAGELSLPGLAAFLRTCCLVVTTDSGPRHIANAVNTRALFFRNTSVSEVETGRYCHNETDLMPPGEFLSERHQENLLKRLSPTDVLGQIERALKSRNT